MRCLVRNKRKFYYALYQGRTEIMDGTYETGEYENSYSTPVECFANISPATGNSRIEQFGNDLQYDKVIVMEDTDMDENSVLWVDVTPPSSFDYIVKRIAKSLNSVSIAISKVNVS